MSHNDTKTHVVDIWRSDLPGGDYGWQCHTCGRDVGGYLGWGTAELGAREHEATSADASSSAVSSDPAVTGSSETPSADASRRAAPYKSAIKVRVR